MGSNGVGQLIPELPEALVLAHIIPRLPWYTRPLCRAISRSWRAKLDTRNSDLDLRTRTIQLPLLRGLFLFCTFDKQIFIRDQEMHHPHRTDAYQIQPHWRRLPPLHSLVMAPPAGVTIIASFGMVYVWSDNMESDGDLWNFVLKLDIGCADWTWKKYPVPYTFNSDAITFDSKIYVPGISLKSPTDMLNHKKVVLVHDMLTDKCKHVDQNELRVLWRRLHSNAHVEEMYSLLEMEMEMDAKLEIQMYDVESDSWRLWERVSIPEVQWSYLPLVKLLNSDCFEPASEAGINIMWIDPESELLSCFNSSLRIPWVNISYNPHWKGNFLEYIQFIRGSVYGIFCNDKEEGGTHGKEEEEERGGGLSGLFRRAIMRGRINVASSSVVWEEVHEVGFFREIYHAESMPIQPIDCYTVMG